MTAQPTIIRPLEDPGTDVPAAELVAVPDESPSRIRGRHAVRTPRENVHPAAVGFLVYLLTAAGVFAWAALPADTQPIWLALFLGIPLGLHSSLLYAAAIHGTDR